MVTQADYTLTACRRRATALSIAAGAVWRRRTRAPRSAFSFSAVVLQLASLAQHEISEDETILLRHNRISVSDFSFNFNALGDQQCLLLFRFKKNDVIRMVEAIAWPPMKRCTSRNRYAVTSILATCLVLRRVSSPARWADLEMLFGKRQPHLSEIYWEVLENMWLVRKQVMTSISRPFLQTRAALYVGAVHRKGMALTNCVGFIDRTVIGIARPKGHRRQRVVYNGHKRKHALKYQAINTPDGLILHAAGPMEGRRHDWTLYVYSGLDSVLPGVLEVEGTRYCLYGDSGYSRRWYLEVLFQGSQVAGAQSAFNGAMSGVRITVEWIFKEVKMHFTIVDFKRKMKLLEGPIGLLFLCCMFLSNCRNCIYPNQIAQYFECAPPSLEQYLAIQTEE